MSAEKPSDDRLLLGRLSIEVAVLFCVTLAIILIAVPVSWESMAG